MKEQVKILGTVTSRTYFIPGGHISFSINVEDEGSLKSKRIHLNRSSSPQVDMIVFGQDVAIYGIKGKRKRYANGQKGPNAIIADKIEFAPSRPPFSDLR